MAEKLVVDSGIAVKWFIDEGDLAEAFVIYEGYQQGKLELLAPDLIFAEFGNILWKKLLFQGLSKSIINDTIEEFRQISFLITPNRYLFEEAFQIAVKHQRTFYDSLYLALSRKENCQFVTADERLYNAVKTNFSNIILLADWK